MRRSLVPMGIVVAAFGLCVPLSGSAQPSFSYASLPAGYVIIQAPMNSQTEFHLDAWGSTGTPPTGFPASSQRLAADLNQRFRVIGNPNLRDVELRFSRFDMDLGGDGTAQDRLYFDWFYASAPQYITGHSFGSTNTILAIPPASGSDSLMFPGTVFRVSTSRSAARQPGGATPEHESWGFVMSEIRVYGPTSPGNSLLPTLAPGQSVVAILLPGSDTVRALLEHVATGVGPTIATWDAQTVTAPGTRLYLRCDADPTATAYDWYMNLDRPESAQGNLFEFNHGCAGQWHLALTNTSPVAHAMRMEIAAHWPNSDRSNINVGIGWNATPAEAQNIAASFNRAAWTLFAATGGNYIMRDFTFVNNSSCSLSQSVNLTACGGNKCDFCANLNGCNGTAGQSGPPRSHFDPVYGYVELCMGDWYNFNTIAHEWAHDALGMPDEYIVSGGAIRRTCGHSIMEGGFNNVVSFCSNPLHLAVTSDSQFQQSISGPIAYWAGGSGVSPTNSAWDYYGYHANPGAGPAYLLDTSFPSMHTFSEFFGNQTMGRP